MSVDFSSENVEARRQQNTFKVMKEKNFIPSIWSFVNEGKIKIFSDEKKKKKEENFLPADVLQNIY